MSSHIPYYVGFSHCDGIGPLTFKELIDRYGSAQKAYEAPLSELEKLIGPKTSNKFDEFRTLFNPKEKTEELLKKGIQVLALEDSDYPKLLAHISDPPICLYVKGDRSIFSTAKDRFFAIVGTRKITPYGAQVTSQFAAGLSQSGFVIVSGMALGIDTAAHEATLNVGGLTVAVLGCGVDIVYPPTNKPLYDRILASGGAIISEFPPGMTTLKGLFVARNRIISGLSRGVLIVEGSARSGTLITARYAAEQGRDVFAPPSPITSQFSQAPNLLIKQGAKMVTSVEDIVDEYQMTSTSQATHHDFSHLPPPVRSVVEVLVSETASADELRDRLSLPIHEVLQALTFLEINGIVAKTHEGKYYVK